MVVTPIIYQQTFLKDAATSSIYGARYVGGVILTTVWVYSSVPTANVTRKFYAKKNIHFPYPNRRRIET